MEQLSNMPIWAQILGWGVFMGLNGYIGATCPGLNLAVLAFMGMFANRKVGIVLVVVAIVVTLAESFWFVLNGFAAGMSSIPRSAPTFLAQGTGILNLIAAGIVFFILMGLFTASFPPPKWLLVGIVVLFYIAGAYAGVSYWIPVMSHGVVLVALGLLVALCHATPAPFAVGLSTLLFLVLAGIWGTDIFHWNQSRISSKRQSNIDTEFLLVSDNNQQEKITQLWTSVNESTKEQALSNALIAKNADLVKFLVKKGTQTEKTMANAIYNKDLDTIKMLVEVQSPITPYLVTYAAEHNFLPAVELFVEKGVDINQKNYRPLSEAAQKSYIEITEYLLKTGKNSQETLDEALVELCDSYNYRDNEGDKENLAKLLLRCGARANSRAGYFNQTPLHGASYYGPLSLVQLLVEKGADVNAIDNEGMSVLMRAVEADNLEIAKFLLQQGAKQTINTVHHFTNSTALFRAKSAPMVQLLLENGADVTSTDRHGTTVLSNAIREDVSLIKLLLKNGVDVNKQDREGKTALLLAVDATHYGGDVETVKLLLENGADVNLADNEGNTPLLIADKLEVMQLLLAHGANVDVKDKYGQSALIRIAQGYDEDGAKVKLLLDHGADINARDDKGNTALTYASSRINKRAWYSEKQIEVLKQHGAKK